MTRKLQHFFHLALTSLWHTVIATLFIVFFTTLPVTALAQEPTYACGSYGSGSYNASCSSSTSAPATSGAAPNTDSTQSNEGTNGDATQQNSGATSHSQSSSNTPAPHLSKPRWAIWTLIIAILCIALILGSWILTASRRKRSA